MVLLINLILGHVAIFAFILQLLGADSLELQPVVLLLDVWQKASERERLVAHSLDVDTAHKAKILNEELDSAEAVLRGKLDHQVQVLLSVNCGTAAFLFGDLHA